MLRIIRICAAAVCFVALVAMFADVTGFAAARWGWMARTQLVPALVGLNVAMIVALGLLTWLVGRVYCSVLCPLGVYQDGVNWLHRRLMSKRTRRQGRPFRAERRAWRRGFAAVWLMLVVAAACGAWTAAYASLLDPYSAFGRMASAFVRPAGVAANNWLAAVAEERGSYAFAALEFSPVSVAVVAVAAVTLLVVTVMAWREGRGYCNTVCPVGTLLGCVSRHAYLRPTVDKDKCNHCRTCERQCKAACIDGRTGEIDLSRCVACMDCIDACPHGAISMRHPSGEKTATADNPSDGADGAPASPGRRAFLVGGAIVAAATVSAKVTDGGMAPVKGKHPSLARVRPVPAGAGSVRRLQGVCTACQLCVSACPNGVLRPSATLSHPMQPEMVYNAGWCRPECTACGDVCPTGAILPLDEAAKSSVSVGVAVVDPSVCLAAQGDAPCGNCARHCPAGAIEMVEVGADSSSSAEDDGEGEGVRRPVVNEAACIGCGSCEYHCPVGSVGAIAADRAAIHVEGREDHVEV